MLDFLKTRYNGKVETADLSLDITIDDTLAYKVYDNGTLTIHAIGKIYVFPKGRWIRFSMEKK